VIRSIRATRSALCLPASERRFIERAREVESDLVILDLEDSVQPDLKEDARAATIAALSSGSWRTPARAVRINALGSAWAKSDLAALAYCAAGLSEVVVPKVHTARELDPVDAALRVAEQSARLPAGSIGIQAQIEDAAGWLGARDVASHPRVTTLAFGPVDFSASLGLRPVVDGHATPEAVNAALEFGLLAVLVAARAHGKTALDGPYLGIRDIDGLTLSARRSAALGLDGKWVLHPGQIAVVNQAFTPSDAEVAHARAIVSSASAPAGAVLLDGEMVDEATRKQAHVVLARHAAARRGTAAADRDSRDDQSGTSTS
jgi:citrate lyase subunit beta/citryl-CoA lyase